MNAFRLDNDIVLITGGGTGLGFATAKRCAEAGAKVVICGRREDVLKQAIQEIGQNVSYEIFDVSEIERVPEFVQKIANKYGPPSVLINNAGINLKKPALEVTDEEFDRIIRTNVNGAFSLTRAVAPAMLEKKKGSIIFIASMASIIGLSKVAAYSASKAAVLGLVRTLASEWSADGVRVNGIAPGFIETPMVRKALGDDPDRSNRVLMRTPIGHLGQPDDIAYAAVYLSSPAAKYVTGAILVVDGGTSIGF